MLTAIWLLLCVCSPTPSLAGVVDRIAAQIDDQLILESEIRLEEQLTTLGPSISPFWSAEHKNSTGRLVDAAVIRLAAGDIDIYQPTDQEVVARRTQVQRRVGDASAWASFLLRAGQTEQTLDTTLRRRMIVERYLGRNNQTDVADRVAWLKTSDEIVRQLQQRSRVRMIELQARP